MKSITFTTALVALIISITDAGKILICVPCPSISHQVVFHTYIKGLLEKGHEVTYITTDPIYAKKEDRPANLTEIDNHDISYGLWNEKQFNLPAATNQGDFEDLHRQFPVMLPVVGWSFFRQMQLPEVQELIKKKAKFDLLVVEGVLKSSQALSHVFKAPMIVMNSLGALMDNHFVIGSPIHPVLLYPDFWHQKLNNLSMFDKIKQLYDIYRIEKFYENFRVLEDNNVKKLFGPDTPSLEELGANVDMMFLNVYPTWESNRPMPPNVIYIGGIHQRPVQELSKDIKQYLDSSKRGVVYFSMGTNVKPSTLSEEKVLAISRGLARLDYEVLIKWDSEYLPEKGDNTKVVTWVAQGDVLRHPKIKAFITQGGLQSFDEALTGGVPLVGIPMFADQWFNVEKYVQLKLGLSITTDLTEDLLYDTINKVIDDPSYRRNMMDYRNRVHDQPETPLQRAIWWSEYLMRHGGAKHMKSPSANMSWSQYLDVPLLTTLALLGLLVISVPVLALYFLGRYVRNVIRLTKKLKVA